ncbi:hypothetical protein [Nonomuraea turcica]|uniref:hypothetical protein n=1 Tax=Nonomuraea sp. G32 TaxID=3067274 RepID=UPI00273A8F65|nr:hypothetical protein [Nonomuraea sp. G32]MDP4512121.1 hypothetical protein [Nonomuraea sp. G32]
MFDLAADGPFSDFGPEVRGPGMGGDVSVAEVVTPAPLIVRPGVDLDLAFDVFRGET